MAIKLSANYSKKLGLPQYSSHSFSVSVEVELSDISQVEAEVQTLYERLQRSVDQEIQNVGFTPGNHANGHPRNGNGHAPQGNGRSYQPNGNGSNGHARNGNGSNGNGNHAPRGLGEQWNCTEGQRGFIQRIVNENSLDKNEVEDLANQLFGLGVKQVNKMQASQLIEELLAKTGQSQGRARWQKQPAPQPA